MEDEGLLVEDDALDWEDVPEDRFVLVRGAAQILDYERLQRIAENYDKLDDFFNPGDSTNQRKKRHNDNRQFRESSMLLETFFKDAIRVKVTNWADCSFVGTLGRQHLREDIHALIYKHGSEPKGEWTMLAEISRIPLPEDSPQDTLFALLAHEKAEDNSTASTEIESLIAVFNAFQEVLGSASYPEVAVSPIAVYREIDTGSGT